MENLGLLGLAAVVSAEPHQPSVCVLGIGAKDLKGQGDKGDTIERSPISMLLSLLRCPLLCCSASLLLDVKLDASNLNNPTFKYR